MTSGARPVALQCIFGADFRRTFSLVSPFRRLACVQVPLQFSVHLCGAPVVQVRRGSLGGELFHIRFGPHTHIHLNCSRSKDNFQLFSRGVAPVLIKKTLVMLHQKKKQARDAVRRTRLKGSPTTVQTAQSDIKRPDTTILKIASRIDHGSDGVSKLARPGATHLDGAALVVARRCKERVYPELVFPRSRSKLVVLAGEVGGWRQCSE